MTTSLNRDTDGFGSLKILRFSEFPEELMTPENAKKWFLHKTYRANESLSACYQEIPLGLRSFEVMLCAAKEGGVNVLQGLSAHQTPGYSIIAEAVTRRNYKTITSVDPDALWQILPDYCWTHMDTIDKIAKELDWFRGALSPVIFEKCCLNIDFALDTSFEQLPKDYLTNLMTKQCSSFLVFRRRGMLDVMADRITIGDWPTNYAYKAFKPSTLEEGVEKLKATSPNSEHEALYMAYAMTYPIEQVVPVMRGSRLRALMVEMYSFDSLKPFMRADRELRGAMLEDGLGL
jgi:hypothetical protein